MIQCPACEQPAAELKASPALCPTCYQEAMNQLTKVWADSGARQERSRIADYVRSLKKARRPLWIDGSTEKSAAVAWDDAVDAALAIVEQKI